ncbi:MAG TPA: dihydroneopterin aldolase [Hanamia sp.]|nr:dihydroneopterin aldolase [Hanamia sp.]
MISVHLHNLVFHAFHGIHDEEKILGNEYVVNVAVEFHESTEVIFHIHETINYVSIYNIIKKRMSVPTPLLETIAMKTGEDIHNQFPVLKSISISIKKMNTPIEGIQGSAGVSWHKEF